MQMSRILVSENYHHTEALQSFLTIHISEVLAVCAHVGRTEKI